MDMVIPRRSPPGTLLGLTSMTALYLLLLQSAGLVPILPP